MKSAQNARATAVPREMRSEWRIQETWYIRDTGIMVTGIVVYKEQFSWLKSQKSIQISSVAKDIVYKRQCRLVNICALFPRYAVLNFAGFSGAYGRGCVTDAAVR